jgi:hypothetical protein
MLPELWRPGEREHSNPDVQSRGPRHQAAREKPLLRPLWRAAHIRELIVAMDKHPGSMSVDHEFLWRELMPCIDGIRALSELLPLLSQNAIRRRLEQLRANQQVILERLDRCASTITEHTPLGARVKGLRDAQGELLQKLAGRLRARNRRGRRSDSWRLPSPCLN